MPKYKRLILRELQAAIDRYKQAIMTQDYLTIQAAKDTLCQCILEVFE